jgi:hypothetical protein
MLTACTDDTNRAGDTSSTVASPPEKPTGETLLLEVPPAWLEVTSQGSDTFKLAEFVPAGQSKESWSDKLFVESNSLQPLPDPIVFLEAMGGELKTECEGSSDANVHTGKENGYEISVRLLICNKNLNSARGEVSIIKAIRGNDNFYVISRARRSDPLQTGSSPLSKTEMGEWSLYMRSIKLCDARDDAHPCSASDP